MKIIVFAFLLCGAFASENGLLEKRVAVTEERLDRMDATLRQILHHLHKVNEKSPESKVGENKNQKECASESLNGNKLNNTDLEQRVQILEVQVSEVQNGVGILEADQIVQDQKILDTQGDVGLLSTGLLTTQEAVAGLGAGQIVQDQKILDVQGDVDLLSTELVSTQESVAGLEGAVVALDSRLDAQELGGAIAFNAAVTSVEPEIPTNSLVVFDRVVINLGEGYNSQTGEFTVPSGGAGLFYFYAHFVFDSTDEGQLFIRHNSRYVCGAYEDNQNSFDFGGSSCGAVVQLNEGDIVDVFVGVGDGTPINGDYGSNINRSTFSGFRIAPA